MQALNGKSGTVCAAQDGGAAARRAVVDLGGAQPAGSAIRAPPAGLDLPGFIAGWRRSISARRSSRCWW